MIESSNKGDQQKEEASKDLEEKELNWKKLLNIGLNVQYYVPNADGITRVKETQSLS